MFADCAYGSESEGSLLEEGDGNKLEIFVGSPPFITQIYKVVSVTSSSLPLAILIMPPKSGKDLKYQEDEIMR